MRRDRAISEIIIIAVRSSVQQKHYVMFFVIFDSLAKQLRTRKLDDCLQNEWFFFTR